MKRRIGLSPGAKLRVLKRDRFTCTYCGVSGVDAELHIDHIIPVSKGGSNNLHNLTTACSQCNLKKSDKIADHPIHNKQQEVKPKTFHIKQPKGSLLEKTEILLLRIYVHFPECRMLISEEVTFRVLRFVYTEHRILWEHIHELSVKHNLIPCPSNPEADFPENKLLNLLRLEYAGSHEDVVFMQDESLLAHLNFYHRDGECHEKLYKTIEEAIIILDLLAWERYGQYCCQQLKKINPQDQPSEFQYYQQKWMEAREESQLLNIQRAILSPIP